MRAYKVLLSVLLMSISTVSFVSYAQGLNSGAYTCGQALTGGGRTQWCECYYHYLMGQCENMGGDDLCSDHFIRDMIGEFGGPKMICEMPSSDPDMSPDVCTSTLSAYVAKCPVN